MTAKTPRFIVDEARALFEMLATTGGIHLVYIHPNGLSIHGKHFHEDVDAALEAAERSNGHGFNIYWSVNCVRPARDRKPGKEDISRARFVHVDIDPPKTGGKFDKPAILDALGNLAAPPSFVIDSGGGFNAFWRLEEPCENLAAIENINVQVRDYFDADACHNIDRVMRVPGTVNYPNARKVARGRGETQACWAAPDDGTVYEPEQLAATFPAARQRSAPASVSLTLPAEIALETPEGLGLGILDPIRLAIAEPPGRDRSGDGLAAARLMANAGYTDAQIMGVLLNSANPVAAHFLDQRDPRRAAARAIQLVRADGPPSGETLRAEQPAMSAEDVKRLVENMKAKARKAMDIEHRPEPESRAGAVNAEPEWLRALGNGGLARFVRHTIATAPSPQPWITLGAALAMFGTAAGRRYAGPTNLRTNIYSIGIADSGGGKDHPLRAVTRLLIDAGMANCVGGSKIASGSGLVTAVTRNPAILFPLDEVGFLISSAADRRRAPKHVTEIIDNLTEFYSLADSTFLGTAYANDKEKPREVIEQPCLSLFGVTTPGVFWGSLSSGNVLDGSLARMLIFQSENHYPDAQHDIARAAMPDDLIELIKAIAQGAEGHNPFPIGNAAQIAPKPYGVPYADAKAEALARAYRDRQIAMLREHQGSNLTGIIARMAENGAKIALIKAITDNPHRPAITDADLDWGMAIARQSVETLMQAVRERVADNEYEATVKRVHLAIANGGAAGIDGRTLSRLTQFVDKRKRADILAHLEEADMIRVEETPQPDGRPGRPRRIYYDIA